MVHRVGGGDILPQQERRAGPQDAQGLVQRFAPLRHEVQHVDRDHGVERGVVEGQRRHIGDLDREAAFYALARLSLPRRVLCLQLLEHARRDVDPCHIHATGQQRQGDTPGANPNLQDLCAGLDASHAHEACGDLGRRLGGMDARGVVAVGHAVEREGFRHRTDVSFGPVS